jgi:hypothetical protein
LCSGCRDAADIATIGIVDRGGAAAVGGGAARHPSGSAIERVVFEVRTEMAKACSARWPTGTESRRLMLLSHEPRPDCEGGGGEDGGEDD